MKSKSVFQKARDQKLMLYQNGLRGMSGSELRKANPELAAKWAKFIEANKAGMVKEIADLLCVS